MDCWSFLVKGTDQSLSSLLRCARFRWTTHCIALADLPDRETKHLASSHYGTICKFLVIRIVVLLTLWHAYVRLFLVLQDTLRLHALCALSHDFNPKYSRKRQIQLDETTSPRATSRSSCVIKGVLLSARNPSRTRRMRR